MTHYCVLILQWYYVCILWERRWTLQNKEPRLLTPDDVAARLQVSKASILRLVKAGKLPASRLGRRTIRITEAAVDALVGQNA